jgi:hypothetical protein
MRLLQRITKNNVIKYSIKMIIENELTKASSELLFITALDCHQHPLTTTSTEAKSNPR